MEVTFIIVLLTIILSIIIRIIYNNLDIITKNNLKIIELSEEINHISEQLRAYNYKNNMSDNEDIDDIYAAIKSINNEIMHIKNKIF
jgi:predicted PurR-regulated permease PerM